MKFESDRLYFQKLYADFYHKSGIRLSFDPIEKGAQAIEDRRIHIMQQAAVNPEEYIPELEQYVQEYPEDASLKTLLYELYLGSKFYEEADKLLEQTLEQHPDYLFGVCNKIMRVQDAEKLNSLSPLLGNPRDIRSFYPQRTIFHFSEFVKYQLAAGHLEAYTGQEDMAIERLQTLLDIGEEENELMVLALAIGIGRLAKHSLEMSRAEENRRVVSSFPKITFEPASEPPVLNHTELNAFYNLSIKAIDDDTLLELFALPRHTLIQDLEIILFDCIRRYNHFIEIDYFSSHTQDFPLHALNFLGALKAEESLPKTLDLLRMGPDFIDFWFSDALHPFMEPVLYDLGENQLQVLKSFVLEENIFVYNRVLVSEILLQVAIRQPHRRQEVLQWYHDVFHCLLADPDNLNLIDTEFISLAVADVIDIGGIELLPIITQLAEYGWIDETLQGGISEIEKFLKNPVPFYPPVPIQRGILEYYRMDYQDYILREEPLKEVPARPSKIEQLIDMALIMAGDGFEGEEDTDYLQEEEDDPYHKPITTVVRPSPKVGRNDPCTCGSGKKYKKCCGKQ